MVRDLYEIGIIPTNTIGGLYISLKSKLRAFSLIEVLISLVLLSTVLMYLLHLTAGALHQAKLLQTKRDMNNAAAYLSGVIERLMITTYRESDWSTILKSGLTLVKTGGNWGFGTVTPSCTLVGNTVSSTCPDITVVAPELGESIGYYVRVGGSDPIYTVTVVVACKDGAPGCDARKLLPLRLTRILIKP